MDIKPNVKRKLDEYFNKRAFVISDKHSKDTNPILILNLKHKDKYINIDFGIRTRRKSFMWMRECTYIRCNVFSELGITKSFNKFLVYLNYDNSYSFNDLKCWRFDSQYMPPLKSIKWIKSFNNVIHLLNYIIEENNHSIQDINDFYVNEWVDIKLIEKINELNLLNKLRELNIIRV